MMTILFLLLGFIFLIQALGAIDSIQDHDPWYASALILIAGVPLTLIIVPGTLLFFYIREHKPRIVRAITDIS